MKNFFISTTALAIFNSIAFSNSKLESVKADQNEVMTTKSFTAYFAHKNQFNQETWAKSILDEVNRLRSQNGFKPLMLSQELMTFAQGRVQDITTNMSHGGTFRSQLGIAAENIVSDLYDDIDVPNFGHRKNMLAPFYNKIGVGVVKKAGENQLYYTMTLYQDPSTKSDHDDWDYIARYLEYCHQPRLDDANYPSKYDMSGKTFYTTYDENGINPDGIEDSTYGPNANTSGKSNGGNNNSSYPSSQWNCETISTVNYINYVPGYSLNI